MTYATTTDIAKQPYADEIDALLDRNGDGSPDASVFDTAAATADSKIDGYLSGRYTTPLSPIPAAIVQIACDIIRYLLWGSNVPAEAAKRYEQAIAELRDYANGIANLTDSGAVVAPVTALAVGYTSRTRIFTDDELSGFVGT